MHDVLVQLLFGLLIVKPVFFGQLWWSCVGHFETVHGQEGALVPESIKVFRLDRVASQNVRNLQVA